MRDEARFTREEVEDIIKQTRLAKEMFPDIYLDYRPFLNIYFPKSPKTTFDRFLRCPAGHLDLRIRYDGKIIQCSNLRVPIADVNEGNLKSIWTSIREHMLQCPYECDQPFQCIQRY